MVYSRYIALTQPVLTFGPSCAPNQYLVDINYDTQWWVEPMYVNTYGSLPGYTGCSGGNILLVKPGNKLQTTMYLNHGTTIWTQNVTNLSNGQSVFYSIDLLGQQQAWAEFIVETAGGWHKNPPKVSFFNLSLKCTTSHSNLQPLILLSVPLPRMPIKVITARL